MAKFLKDILGEVAQPKAGDEKRFKEKHVAGDKPYPGAGTDDVLNARKAKKDKSKLTHMTPDEEESMYEETEFDNAINVIADILAEDDEELFVEGIVDTLSLISKTKKEQYVKLNDGTEIEVDSDTADSIVNVLEYLNDDNKAVFVNSLEKDEESFLRMVDFAVSMRGDNG